MNDDQIKQLMDQMVQQRSAAAAGANWPWDTAEKEQKEPLLSVAEKTWPHLSKEEKDAIRESIIESGDFDNPYINMFNLQVLWMERLTRSMHKVAGLVEELLLKKEDEE